MFTGIIETLGEIEAIVERGGNLRFTIRAPFAKELKVDQSVAHDGVCLTVIETAPEKSAYVVEAVAETLNRSTLGGLAVGSVVNLERAMQAGGRLDGHFVQGHVDAVGRVVQIETLDGSWYFDFETNRDDSPLLVEKGSVAVNGVSLTVAALTAGGFRVAIIPYTFKHTNFYLLKINDNVNLEYDILGKYVRRALSFQKTV